MIKSSFTFTFVLSILYVTLFSWSQPVLAQKKCLSHHLDQQQMEADPTYRSRRQRMKTLVQNYLKNTTQSATGSTVTIPVVFQIIHNGDDVGSNENVSDALINAQLAQLNADFGRMNSDANMTPAAFQGVAANTMIQFCLATVDPNGQPTNGIVRYDLNLNQNVCWNSNFISNNIVNGRAWNTANYLNIFTVLKIATDDCSSNDILGYATFPGGNANLDVAVHGYYTIGSLSMANPAGGVYGLGRTVTHEVGHWLMLEHIWYDGGCGTDDGVADTPPQDGSTLGCPTFPTTDACTSTGNGIMFMNYMDYVNDNCMNMFTQGQANRMMAAITNSRPGLLTSGGCGGSCTPPVVNAPTITQPTCATPTGTIVVNATGGGTLEYSVDNGSNYQASNTFNSQALGTYNIRVRLQSQTSCSTAYAQNPVTLIAATGCGGGNCQEYTATDVPITISDQQTSTITSTINIVATATITDVNVKNLAGTHDYLEDLTFTLTHMNSSTSVVLISKKCGNSTAGFNISLDDQAATDLSCPLNDMATEKPENPLLAFNGLNPMGEWKLQIEDDFDTEGGVLNGWTLEICVQNGGGCPPTLAVDDNPITAGTYQAGTQLTSMGHIATSGNVTFRAGNNVELKPNFEISGNATLEVKIGGCQ